MNIEHLSKRLGSGVACIAVVAVLAICILPAAGGLDSDAAVTSSDDGDFIRTVLPDETVKQGSSVDFTVNVPASEVKKLYMDSKVLSKTYYTVEGTDSAEISISSDYTKEMDLGSHQVKVTTDSGDYVLNLTVKSPTKVNWALIIVGVASLVIGIVAIALAMKNRKG